MSYMARLRIYSFRADESLIREIRRVARAEGRLATALVRELVRKGLDNRTSDPEPGNASD